MFIPSPSDLPTRRPNVHLNQSCHFYFQFVCWHDHSVQLRSDADLDSSMPRHTPPVLQEVHASSSNLLHLDRIPAKADAICSKDWRPKIQVGPNLSINFQNFVTTFHHQSSFYFHWRFCTFSSGSYDCCALLSWTKIAGQGTISTFHSNSSFWNVSTIKTSQGPIK